MRRGRAELFGVVGGFVEASRGVSPSPCPLPAGERVLRLFSALRWGGYGSDLLRACSCNHCAAPRPAIRPLAKQAVSR